MRQVIHITVLLAALLTAAFSTAQAADDLKMIEGVVVSAQTGTLVVKDEQNRTHTHSVDSSAQVIVEGNLGQLEDIKMGMKAHMALDAGKVFSVSATKPMKLRAQVR